MVGSYSTPVDAADPFRQMTVGRLQRPERLLVRRRRLPGRARRAGRRLPPALGRQRRCETVYGAAGPRRHRHRVPRRRRSSRARWSAARRRTAADAGRPGRSRSRRRGCSTAIAGGVFANDPFVPAALPGVPADGTELLALDSDGDRPLGGRRRRRLGPVGAARAARSPRPPLAARLVGGAFEELTLSGAALRPERPLRRRRRDAGQRRRDGDAWSPSPTAAAPTQGDRGADRAPTARSTTTALPAAGRRPRQRRPDRLPGAERRLDGHLGRLALPLHRRHAAAARHRPGLPGHDRRSAPTRRPSSSSPTRCRPTTRSCSRRRRSKRGKKKRRSARSSACRRCCARSTPKLHGLTPDGHLHRDAARRGCSCSPSAAAGSSRARPSRTSRPGRHELQPAAQPRALPDRARLRDQGAQASEPRSQANAPRSLGQARCGFAARRSPLAWLTVAVAAAARGERRRRRASRRRCRCSGPPTRRCVLMGVAPAGEPGEAWAYRQLPLARRRGRRRLARARLRAAADAASPPSRSSPSCATPTRSGWQVFETPVDANGNPYRGPDAEPALGADHPRRAAGCWSAATRTGRRASRWSCSTTTRAAPGARCRLRRPTSCCPAEGEAPAEALADDSGAGAVADAAFDEGGHTGLFFAPKGRSVDDAVIHCDGGELDPRAGRGPGRLGSQVPHPRDRRDRARQRLGARRSRPNRSAAPSSCCSGPHAGSGPLWVERGLGAAQFADAEHAGRRDRRPGADRRRRAAADRHRRRRLDRPQRRRSTASAATSTLFYDIGAGARHRLLVRRRRSASGGARRQVLAPGRLPQLRLGRAAASARGSSPTRSTRAAATRATAAPTCASADGGFARMPGGGGNFRASGAFASADSGWLEGPVEISDQDARRAACALAGLAARAADRRSPAPGRARRRARLRRAGGRRRRQRRPLRARAGLAARVPAHLERRGQQGDAARRRLARSRRAPTRSATSARCGCGTPATTSGTPTPACRSASRAT